MNEYISGLLTQHVRGTRPVSAIVKKFGQNSVRPNPTPTPQPQTRPGKSAAAPPSASR
jgi:hypothetical protein